MIKDFIQTSGDGFELRKNSLALIAVFFGIAFALAAICFYGIEKFGAVDTSDYINAANSFLNGTPYPRRSEFHPMFRPPLYPLFIAAI